MFLSIVIPIWNDEAYLNECLDSCLDQGLSEDEYEIICVDDGSTDRTPEILRQYASQHGNIRLIFKEHTGFGGRNVGFKEASGDFVWFVDHDDLVAPHAVDRLRAFVLENSECERVTFRFYEFYNKLTEMEQAGFRDGTLRPNDEHSPFRDMAAWPSILKTSFLRENGIEPRSRRIAAAGKYWGIEPFSVWSGDRILIEECIDKKIRTLPMEGPPLYFYRRHPNSETMRINSSSIKNRAHLRYHSALVRGYLALLKKQEYEHERVSHGLASKETTVQTVLLLRTAAGMLAKLPREYWREGMRRLEEKDAFFRGRPEEYDFSLGDYLKTRTLRERLSPKIYAYYYSYTAAGARWVRRLNAPDRILTSNKTATKMYRRRREKTLRKQGGAEDQG